MDSKAPTSVFTTYRELPLDLDVPPAGSIVHIQLPTTGAFGRTSRLTRQVLSNYPAASGDDNTNKSKSVADASGQLSRAVGRYPRNILWRSLNEGATLELRSVDLSKDKDESREAGVIVQLTLPTGLRKGCVGLADGERGDHINVFALTKNNDLYTFNLRSSFFCKHSASEEELGRWCQTSRPPVLSISQPFKLTHCGSNDVVFALGDGRLVHLTRQSGADGRSWNETVYADGQWGPSLRGLISWQGQNKIRHDGFNLAHSTALAATPSPDGKHLISVTLNHSLRIWSAESQKPTLTRDLLNIEREPNSTAKILLDPSQTQVLALEAGLLMDFSGDKYYLLTFSPHETGSFKVWGVRDADHGNGLRDVFPDDTLRVPDPDDGALWTLADFRVASVPSSNQISMWIMLRLNKRYQLFHKTFTSFSKLADEWQSDWERTEIDPLKSHSKFDAALQEPQGLALDVQQSMPWILSTTTTAPVRVCTDMESLMYNTPSSFLQGSQSVAPSIEGGSTPLSSETATLTQAGGQFRSGLDQGPIEEAVRLELWQDPSVTASARIQAFYDNAGFSSVPDREYNDLLSAIQNLGGPDSLTTDLFFGLLETFPDRISESSGLASTSFGRKALVTGATELIELQEQIVTDLLCMVVFIDQEVDRAETSLAVFNTARIFEELVSQLRIIQISRWIATNSLLRNDRRISVLEHVFARDIQPQSTEFQTGSAALSGALRDLIKWISGGNDPSISMEEVAVNIQCTLLSAGELALATKFLRYQPSTAWATYVRARHCLLCHDHVSAAVYFKKAAFNLSRSRRDFDYRAASAGLIDAVESLNLASGLSNYYTHVAHLFSLPSISAHAQTIQFTTLALQHLPSDETSPSGTLALASFTTPSSNRSDLLARLFSSSLALDDYDRAFSAMVRYTDAGLCKAALKSLVTTMLGAGAASELVALPFPGALKPEVDAMLTEMVRTEAESSGGSSSGSKSLGGFPSSAASGSKAVKVLYAWKVRQGDYRGAAACIIERLHAQKKSSRKRRKMRAAASGNSAAGTDDEPLNEYLIAINALSMVAGEQGVDKADSEGWVFVEDGNGADSEGGRSLIRLRDLRREYQEEMDLREKWDRGRFALTAGDDSDDDEDDGDAMEM